MANIPRSAKLGSEWTRNELYAYNITVALEDAATFFGSPDLPQPSVNQVILNNAQYPANGIVDRNDRAFFFYLEDAMRIPPSEESAVDDFSAHLLVLLGFDGIGGCERLIRQQKEMPFLVCGVNTHAKTDVCVINRNLGLLLLIQEDKRHLEEVDLEPQLIAEAIAAFQYNNSILQRKGLQPLEHKTFPGVVMIGTAPTFYKVTVTKALVEAVETAQYPLTRTIVHKLLPPVADPGNLYQVGMMDLNNRAVILSCFEALKQFV